MIINYKILKMKSLNEIEIFMSFNIFLFNCPTTNVSDTVLIILLFITFNIHIILFKNIYSIIM